MVDPVLEIDATARLHGHELRLVLRSSRERIAIVGPSGAGKSTALRIIAGIQSNARGRVTFRGQRWRTDAQGDVVSSERRSVGWVPQDALLFPHVDVRRNLAWGSDATPRLEAVASQLRVDHLLDRRPRNLSGGERQRVALARALLSAPRLLLLDEPFVALDRPLRAHVAEVVLRYCDEHDAALVLVSHDDHDVSRLAQAVFRLGHDGRLEPAA